MSPRSNLEQGTVTATKKYIVDALRATRLWFFDDKGHQRADIRAKPHLKEAG